MVVRVQRYPFQGYRLPRLFDLTRGIDGLFSDFAPDESELQSAGFPLTDITEDDNAYVILAELPGVRKEDVKLSIQDGEIKISGERKPVALPEKAQWVRNEISTGQFVRTIRVPGDVSSSQVSAELTDGVLRVVLPKTEKAKAHEVVVK